MKMRTINEAVDDLGVSRDRLTHGIEDGRYPTMKWGNRKLLDVDAVREIIRREDTEEQSVGIIECARLIGMSVNTVRRMAASGTIPATRKGRYYQFLMSNVRKAIENRMKKK